MTGHTGVVPEGDTIHRSATRLATALARRELVRYSGPRLGIHAPQPGTRIDTVEARGKYLLIHFADGTVLETHMRMNGSWHLYRRGERWRRSRGNARAVVETDEWTAVCFSAPHVVLRSAAALDGGAVSDDPRRAGPERLGPDLASENPDFDETLERLERFTSATTPAAAALLDQRIFAGVGNVFKSEVLFACNVHPETPVGQVPVELRRRLAETAHGQLRANLGPGPRTTVPEGLAVYGRAGRPCLRCGHLIERGRHGPNDRSTYWCPSCQPAPGRTTPDS
ncbi:MAG: DNA-formamidopyrimidine glycosylase family protein [Acidimicrobiales bacterium]